MGMPSNCTPNDEPPIQMINPEVEDLCKKQEFLEETDSKSHCAEFLDAQCQSPNFSQEPTTCEPSTSSVSAAKESWLTRWTYIGGVNKFLIWLLSFCLPIDNTTFTYSGGSESIMVCIPGNQRVMKPKTPETAPKKELKPIGMITRIKEADFIGGKMVGGCSCGRKNGLTGECPRMSCQGNPGCSMNPPQCWPQFKEPEPPSPPVPPQKIICIPIKLVYGDPPEGEIT